MLRIYVIFFLVFSFVTLRAQSFRKLARLAQSSFDEHNYNDAFALSTELLKNDSLNTKYLYMAGVSAFELREFAKATQHLQTFTAKIPKKDALLSYGVLAQCYETKQEYKKALKWYKKQLGVNSKKLKNTNEYRLYEQRISSCEYAIAQLKLKPKNLATYIDSANTKYSEMYPNFIDSATLLVARFDSSATHNNYIQHLGATELFNNTLININYNSALTNINNTIAYNVSKHKLVLAQWSANTINNTTVQWQEIDIDVPQTVQPCLAFINDTLRIIYSAFVGTQRKIYLSTQLSLTQYTTPKLLIKGTAWGSDVTPFYSQLDSALYFSTNYTNGFGGYDIVVSTYNSITHSFETPANIGASYNSSYNDVYYAQNFISNKAAWVSNRPCIQNNFNTCCNDVWAHEMRTSKLPFFTTKMPMDSLTIYTNKINALLPLTLYFHNDEPNPRTADTNTVITYTQTYINYNLMRNKYANEYSNKLNTPQKEQAVADMQLFFEDYVTAGYNDLQLFVSYLNKIQQFKDTSLTILMKGFCSPLATNDYNKKLAKRRIASLRNDLIQHPLIMQIYNNNKIIFTQDNIGEDAADSSISDNINDTQKSVYSIKAASERRIQILRVQ
ncbi:MAG: hypothetical protein H7331_03490 [Bacteroidia bacterium]|nr:hypothetical protein [Bacteroidia bacterium]